MVWYGMLDIPYRHVLASHAGWVELFQSQHKTRLGLHYKIR